MNAIYCIDIETLHAFKHVFFVVIYTTVFVLLSLFCIIYFVFVLRLYYLYNYVIYSLCYKDIAMYKYKCD